mgnify:CR=1 FL=1
MLLKTENQLEKRMPWHLTKNFQDYGMSKEKIKETLLSEEDGGGFTKSEANYAIKHLEDED